MIDPATETGSAVAVRAAFKEYMRAHKITQRQLAKQLDVTEKHLSQLFRGHIRMTFIAADAIAEALGFEVAVHLDRPLDRSPDRDCVFVDVSGTRVTLTHTTGRRLNGAINGQWVPLPDRERVSVETAVGL